MRNAFAESFHAAAKKDARLAMVVADISAAGAMDNFRKEFPTRFVNTGVAEQIMIGMCAGMSMRGLKPFAYTIATFALFRPYEFIRDDLAYQGLPVTVVGIGGGVTYSQLGGTHHAMEDVSIACAMPNMRVIAPCDPDEVRAATQWCISQEEGPVYLRLGKAGEKNISTNATEPWRYGKVRYLKGGREACIVGYGPVLALAMEAADGQDIAVVSVSTLKPLDKDGLGNILRRYPLVVVLEEAVMRGGLGEAIKSLAFDLGSRCKIATMALKDSFIHHYGSHADLLEKHGITVEKLKEKLNG
jgi:transketolase